MESISWLAVVIIPQAKITKCGSHKGGTPEQVAAQIAGERSVRDDQVMVCGSVDVSDRKSRLGRKSKSQVGSRSSERLGLFHKQR